MSTQAIEVKTTAPLTTIPSIVNWIIAVEHPNVFSVLQSTLGYQEIIEGENTPGIAISIGEYALQYPTATILIHATKWRPDIAVTLAQIRNNCPKTPILLLLEYCPIVQKAEIVSALADQKVSLVRICTREAIQLSLTEARLLLHQADYYFLERE